MKRSVKFAFLSVGCLLLSGIIVGFVFGVVKSLFLMVAYLLWKGAEELDKLAKSYVNIEKIFKD